MIYSFFDVVETHVDASSAYWEIPNTRHACIATVGNIYDDLLACPYRGSGAIFLVEYQDEGTRRCIAFSYPGTDHTALHVAQHIVERLGPRPILLTMIGLNPILYNEIVDLEESNRILREALAQTEARLERYEPEIRAEGE